MFSGHNRIKLQISNRKISKKLPDIGTLDNILLQPGVKVPREFTKCVEWIAKENTISKFTGCS